MNSQVSGQSLYTIPAN